MNSTKNIYQEEVYKFNKFLINIYSKFIPVESQNPTKATHFLVLNHNERCILNANVLKPSISKRVKKINKKSFYLIQNKHCNHKNQDDKLPDKLKTW